MGIFEKYGSLSFNSFFFQKIFLYFENFLYFIVKYDPIYSLFLPTPYMFPTKVSLPNLTFMYLFTYFDNSLNVVSAAMLVLCLIVLGLEDGKPTTSGHIFKEKND